MEACLHFRGAALNASEAGISRATECRRSTPHCGSEGDHSSPVGTEGHNLLESFGFWRRKFCIKNAEILSAGKIAEFAKFAGGKRRKFPDSFCFTSWPKAGMLLTGGLLTLCWSLRKYNGNSPIPYAHKGKSSDGCAC